MSVKRGTPEGVYGESNPQDLCDMAKAERLEARFQWPTAGPLMTTPMQGQRTDRINTECDLESYDPSAWGHKSLPIAGRRVIHSHKER
jgi:hypothetical protein